MNTYYAAIVNHPNQKLDPDNNIPLIQTFHSATERNNSASPTASIETRRFPPA